MARKRTNIMDKAYTALEEKQARETSVAKVLDVPESSDVMEKKWRESVISDINRLRTLAMAAKRGTDFLNFADQAAAFVRTQGPILIGVLQSMEKTDGESPQKLQG